jgi:signal transduction histidine kinase
MELITRREEADGEIYALFDWAQFDDPDLYLDEVIILVESRSAERITPAGMASFNWAPGRSGADAATPHGTVLRMNGLKRDWAERDFSDLQRDLSRLVSPFADLQDFSIRVELPQAFADWSRDVDPPSVIEYPHYIVTGWVQAQGKAEVHIRVETHGTDHVEAGLLLRSLPDGEMVLLGDSNPPEDTVPPECGPLSFELRVWDRDVLGNVVQETGQSIRQVRRDLDAVAGINIYRDGFRVLPYGEPKDDWLRLDMRRVQNPTLRISNNQISGYIMISADRNPGLHDQSNREGLDENQPMADLRGMMICVLAMLESRRRETRRPSGANDTPGLKKEGLFADIGLDALRERVEKACPGDMETLALVQHAENQFSERLLGLKNVLARYHGLATLGQLVDRVIHEGRQPVAAIKDEAVLVHLDLEDALNGPCAQLAGAMAEHLRLIEQQAGILATAFKHIEPFGGRKRGRPSPLYLETIIADAFAVRRTDLDKYGIQTALPESRTLVTVDEPEIQEVIINLLNNSIYWLCRVDKRTRRIVVAVERRGADEVEIRFADTGPGIPREYRESVFSPYFTTKPDGVGLGLSICGEIISDFYGGELVLLDPDGESGAAFRITLRKRV